MSTKSSGQAQAVILADFCRAEGEIRLARELVLDFLSLMESTVGRVCCHGENILMNAGFKTTSALDLTASAALLAAAILWASSFVAMKLALQGFHPMAMIFMRMAVACLSFLFLWRRLFHTFHYQAGDWKLFVGMGLAEPCLYFIFEAYALRYTSASQAGMVVSIMPLLVAVAAFFILKEKMSRAMLAGLLTAVAGVLLLSLTSEGEASAPNPILGNGLELLAMCCATVYTICANRLTRRYSPLFVTAVQAFLGLIFFAPIVIIMGVWPPDWPPVPTLAVAYLGVGITIGAYGLYNFGVSRLPAGQAAAYTNLIPVFTLIMGYFILDETLLPIQYCACVLVLGGVMLSQCRRG